MELARVYARRSKDPSTQVGAIIVGPNKEQRSGGYNGLPRGVDDSQPERWTRPDKLAWCEHAERNAIFNAARIGVSCDGCTLYVSSLPPCADCARAIIQSGIVEVVHDSTYCADFMVEVDQQQYCAAEDHCLTCGELAAKHIPKRWLESMQLAHEMMKEAGVAVRRTREA